MRPSLRANITLGDSRCLSTFPLQVHAIFCMQPVQMTDVLPRDWSLLSWNLERRPCRQAHIRNIIPRRKRKGILGRTLNDKGGQNFGVDLCIYVCFCNCICYVTVFLKLKPACKCVSSWQSGSRPMIDRLCLSLTASLLISQSEMFSIFIQVSFAPFLNPFCFQSCSNQTSITINSQSIFSIPSALVLLVVVPTVLQVSPSPKSSPPFCLKPINPYIHI